MRLIDNEGRRPVHRGEPRPPGRSFDETLQTAGASTPGGHRPVAPSLPELREASRVVPTAIWAGRLAHGAEVELSFGRDLAVGIRQVSGGVELEVRACAALERAARADLPALVEALRARGVTVVRACVRGGSEAGTGRGGSRGRGSASR